MLQIDNLDYYYIRYVKLGFNENWYIDENLREKISISVSEIIGIDKIIINKVNSILKNRGFELVKLYANENAYIIKIKKLIIDIEKYNKVGLHPLNFIVFNDNEFCFSFTTYIIIENIDEHVMNVGLYINIKDNICKIQNKEYQRLNSLTYKNEDEIKKK